MNYLHSFQKSFSSLLILVMLVPTAYLTSLTIVPPQKAEASVDFVFDIGNTIAHFGTWIKGIAIAASSAAGAASEAVSASANSLTSAADSWYTWVKTLTLDTIAYAIKRALVLSITNKMIAYVQTGFSGGPTYVQNPGKYYGNVANSATQVYLYELDRLKKAVDPVSLTNKILDDTQRRLEANAYATYQQAMTPAAGNEFPGGQAGYNAYMNDFRSCQGTDGWKCFESLSDPANDPWAVANAQQAELKKRQSEALTLAHQEIATANGFATIKTCVKSIVRDNVKQCTDYLTKIPGKIIVDQLQKYQASSLDELHNVHSIQESVFNSLIQACTDWMVNGLGGPSISTDTGGPSLEDALWNPTPTCDKFIDNKGTVTYADAKGASCTPSSDTAGVGSSTSCTQYVDNTGKITYADAKGASCTPSNGGGTGGSATGGAVSGNPNTGADGGGTSGGDSGGGKSSCIAYMDIYGQMTYADANGASCTPAGGNSGGNLSTKKCSYTCMSNDTCQTQHHYANTDTECNISGQICCDTTSTW